MSGPTTSIVGTNIRISWTVPETNGAAMTSYIIVVRDKTNFYYSDITSCDGTNPTIVAQLYCDIPMATLRATPFSLIRGDSIYTKVNGANIKGYNDSLSSSNSVR